MTSPGSGSFSSGTAGDVVDDLDQFVQAVAVPAGEQDEFVGLGDDRAVRGGAGNGNPSAAAELEQASSRSNRSARSTVLVFTPVACSHTVTG